MGKRGNIFGTISKLNFCCVFDVFMPPAWKVRRGHLVFGLSVCPFVRNSVPLTNKVQYLKFGWSYSNQTWTVSSSMGCSHFTDIPCPWGSGRVKMWNLEFSHILTLLPPGASVFHKHMSSFDLVIFVYFNATSIDFYAVKCFICMNYM